MIRFICKIDKKSFENVFNIPSVEVGILKNRPAMEIKKDKSKTVFVKNFKGSNVNLKVNKKGKESKTCTVGELLSRVLESPDFANDFLAKALQKMPMDVWRRYLFSKKNEQNKLELSNGILSAFLHSYINYAHDLSPSEATIRRKGHSLYMIATGTTFKSIRAVTKN